MDWYVFSGCATRTCQREYILCHGNTDAHTCTRVYTRGLYLLLSRRTYKSAGRLSEYFPSNLISRGWNARYACVTSHICGDKGRRWECIAHAAITMHGGFLRSRLEMYVFFVGHREQNSFSLCHVRCARQFVQQRPNFSLKP